MLDSLILEEYVDMVDENENEDMIYSPLSPITISIPPPSPRMSGGCKYLKLMVNYINSKLF